MLVTGDLTLRIMYAVAIVGAGAVGAVTLLAPSIAARYVFAGDTPVDVYLRILGALWLAIGVLAVLGLMRPAQFIPLLLLQLVYKTAWLGAAAFPALIAGQRAPGLVFLTGLFTVWVIALLVTIPFQSLLAER